VKKVKKNKEYRKYIIKLLVILDNGIILENALIFTKYAGFYFSRTPVNRCAIVENLATNFESKV